MTALSPSGWIPLSENFVVPPMWGSFFPSLVGRDFHTSTYLFIIILCFFERDGWPSFFHPALNEPIFPPPFFHFRATVASPSSFISFPSAFRLSHARDSGIVTALPFHPEKRPLARLLNIYLILCACLLPSLCFPSLCGSMLGWSSSVACRFRSESRQCSG